MSKLNGDGEIAGTELKIEERKGAIVLWVGEDTYVILHPEQAMVIGETLVEWGYHAKTGQDRSAKGVMSEKIREKLENRVMLVIANLQDKKQKPLHVAQEVVNIVLQEAL